MKELKVRFHSQDSGYCHELWEVYTEKGRPRRFLVRDTMDAAGRWQYGNGPADCCEPGFDVGDDTTLILCDKDWNEQARTGNDCTRFPEPFPTRKQACLEAWNHLPRTGPILDTSRFWEWFSAYIPQGINPVERDNWQYNHIETLRREVLDRFDYCGSNLPIIRLTQRHTCCGATWCMYFVDTDIAEESGDYIHFFGYECGNYIIQTDPLKIANLPYNTEYEGVQLCITAEDIKKFNSLVGSFSPSLHRSRDPKMKFLVSVLKQRAARLNAGLEPSVDKHYFCATCGSRSGQCHPVIGYCFECNTDNWTPDL